jgi:tyrosine decarboxylase / aspartate 1-decarboxylase
MLEKKSLTLLPGLLSTMDKGFAELPPFANEVDEQSIERVLEEVAQRMQDNFPYPHPLYAGQMLKPPHAVARLAYTLSLWINPNNHALDGGRASSQMEKEAVAEIASMFGFEKHLGHLCGGGTIANLEALWVASKLHPDRLVVASEQAHYTHNRLCGVLKIPFASIPVDGRGRMSIKALESVLKQGQVGTVVATLGTTATGSVDPLVEIIELQSKYNFRLHVDSAYGGYFKLANNLGTHAEKAFAAIAQADSIVVDPHKHGLQPYGCGCVLFKDPAVGALYKHDSPYTYFSSDELHLGEISLECSRPGSAAVALWATQRLLPLVQGGEFAQGLQQSRQAALKLHSVLSADSRFIVPFEPELDIVIYAVKAKTASQASSHARAMFDICARHGLHLAVANLPRGLFADWEDVEWDQDTVACLRSCLMKPEHLDWVDEICQILDLSLTEVMNSAAAIV